MNQLAHYGQVGCEFGGHGKIDGILHSKTGAHCAGKGNFHLQIPYWKYFWLHLLSNRLNNNKLGKSFKGNLYYFL
jgi:hypothetical protein